MLVALIGPMGVGKTTIGKILANSLELAFFDLDEEIEKSTGVDVQCIFDIEGETGFRNRENVMLRRLSDSTEKFVLSTGGGVVKTPANRVLLRRYTFVIYLSATADYLFERLQYDTKRPLLAVDDPRAALREIIAERESLYEQAATHHISIVNQSAQQITRKILNTLQHD